MSEDNKSNVEKIRDMLSIAKTSPESLNQRLIHRQGLSDKEVHDLCRLHDKKDLIFEKFAATRSKKVYKSLVAELEGIEFAMQKAWKFNQDRNYHTWWNKVPKCKCSSFSGERQYNPACPIHS